MATAVDLQYFYMLVICFANYSLLIKKVWSCIQLVLLLIYCNHIFELKTSFDEY